MFSNFLKGENVRSRRRRYEITIIRFEPEPVTVAETFGSSEEAAAWIDASTASDCCIDVSAWQGDFSLGDFFMWCSGAYAVARIGEHRDHNASNPDGAIVVNHPVTFRDDDGSPYIPSSELVLQRELAMRAIHEWLVDLKHPSFLRWS